MESKGLRYNSGKNRVGLVVPELVEEIGKVLTFGAKKYNVFNWQSGLSTTEILDSLERHLLKYKNGEDFDDESGLLHLSHVGCNLMFLIWMMKHRPDLDDRPHFKRNKLKVGFDVDEVLCDFMGGYCEYFGIKETPANWNFDIDFNERMKHLSTNKEFYLNLKPLIKAEELKIIPHCYITSRHIPVEWTEEWLHKNGFPNSKVYLAINGDKLTPAIESGIDAFIDDYYENYRILNENGICCFLMDQPHNRRYDVGYRRIMNLKDFKI